MNKFKKIFYLTVLLLLSSISIYSSGNLNNYELGTAIYRNMSINTAEEHWHSGVFRYFEYFPSVSEGHMHYAEAQGVWTRTYCKSKLEYIPISNYASKLADLKTSFKNAFRHGNNLYQGAYSRNDITPSERSSIVATATSVGNYHIDYTWADMLDPNNVWCWDHWWYCEHWNGQLYNIDELRCDGVAEYSYEKHGVHVANNNLIGSSGQGHVDAHNDLHTYGYNSGELCPKIQAGEDCHYYSPGSGTNHSVFDPLQSDPPSTWNFSKTQFSNKIQINFKILENASVKCYVLIQVKKTNENTWHTLIDQNNNTWKFKVVDLTDWFGGYQSDNFHIPWTGKYDGGQYFGVNNYNLKITVIDQGANFIETSYSFTGELPEVNVIISGPTFLEFKEKGPWIANVSDGSGSYNYSWYKSSNGGSTWNGPFNSTNTFNTTMMFSDFILRCDVTDTQTNETDSDTHEVIYNDGELPMPKIENNNDVIELPKETALESNYPNPFNPTTTIKYQLKDDGFVSLKVYDILGKEVAELVNENKSAGFYNTNFDATNLASGLYVYRLHVNGFVESKKMMLTK